MRRIHNISFHSIIIWDKDPLSIESFWNSFEPDYWTVTSRLPFEHKNKCISATWQHWFVYYYLWMLPCISLTVSFFVWSSVKLDPLFLRNTSDKISCSVASRRGQIWCVPDYFESSPRYCRVVPVRKQLFNNSILRIKHWKNIWIEELPVILSINTTREAIAPLRQTYATSQKLI